jgi:hypothetical protein
MEMHPPCLTAADTATVEISTDRTACVRAAIV